MVSIFYLKQSIFVIQIDFCVGQWARFKYNTHTQNMNLYGREANPNAKSKGKVKHDISPKIALPIYSHQPRWRQKLPYGLHNFELNSATSLSYQTRKSHFCLQTELKYMFVLMARGGVEWNGPKVYCLDYKIKNGT